MTQETFRVENDVPFWLVIPAAGSSTRMKGVGDNGKPKQYQLLAGRPVLQRTLDVFLSIHNLKGIVVALHADDQDFTALPAAKHALVKTVVGGAERSASVLNALTYLSSKAQTDDWVLVHDAARPLVNAQDVAAMLKSLATSDIGGIMAVPVSDTVKVVLNNDEISTTEDRSRLWQAQTPQMFRLPVLLKALQQAKHKNITVTDEASAMEQLGHKPLVFQGRPSNIKITVPDDWAIATSLLNQESPLGKTAMNSSIPRIGHGFDVHRFADDVGGSSIVLGGVTIPHHKKLLAHSDGDVLIHALCDALLGAAALGDIGKHFPDTDSSYKNINSRHLLCRVVDLLKEKRFEIANVDITVVAQAPKVQPHVAAMRSNLAQDLSIDVGAVNVKATTTEKLGFEGREEGISCHAVALIYEKSLT